MEWLVVLIGLVLLLNRAKLVLSRAELVLNRAEPVQSGVVLIKWNQC